MLRLILVNFITAIATESDIFKIVSCNDENKESLHKLMIIYKA